MNTPLSPRPSGQFSSTLELLEPLAALPPVPCHCFALQTRAAIYQVAFNGRELLARVVPGPWTRKFTPQHLAVVAHYQLTEAFACPQPGSSIIGLASHSNLASQAKPKAPSKKKVASK